MPEKDQNSSHPAEQSFDVRFLAEGKQSTVLFLPEAFQSYIGLVVAYWGNFEVAFDACLRALIAGEEADGGTRKSSGWERQSFKQRCKLFRAITEGWLARWHQDGAARLLAICDSSLSLQAQRNMIAHGTYGYTIPPYSSVASECYAISHSTGEKMPFDESVLKRIYHDISHLTADMLNAFKEFGEVQGPFYTVNDSELLRIYYGSIHPWNPDPQLRPNAVQQGAEPDGSASGETAG